MTVEKLDFEVKLDKVFGKWCYKARMTDDTRRAAFNKAMEVHLGKKGQFETRKGEIIDIEWHNVSDVEKLITQMVNVTKVNANVVYSNVTKDIPALPLPKVIEPTTITNTKFF